MFEPDNVLALLTSNEHIKIAIKVDIDESQVIGCLIRGHDMGFEIPTTIVFVPTAIVFTPTAAVFIPTAAVVIPTPAF